jgi:hypothetical protein
MKKTKKDVNNAPVPRAPSNSTFDGLGVLGGLALAGVTNSEVKRCMLECKLKFGNEEVEKVTHVLVSQVA